MDAELCGCELLGDLLNYFSRPAWSPPAGMVNKPIQIKLRHEPPSMPQRIAFRNSTTPGHSFTCPRTVSAVQTPIPINNFLKYRDHICDCSDGLPPPTKKSRPSMPAMAGNHSR